MVNGKCSNIQLMKVENKGNDIAEHTTEYSVIRLKINCAPTFLHAKMVSLYAAEWHPAVTQNQ